MNIPEAVARQAARTPESLAVTGDQGDLTYADLIRRADQVAHLLRRHGAGRETVVGVRMRRGIDLPVALLGAWRAGAAYLPLDPDHPAERTRWMIEDTGARVVLTDGEPAGTPEGVTELPIALAGAEPDTPSGMVTDPGAAAYVIYTSGSTGRPKGVVVTHEGIGNRVAWTVRCHGLSVTDRILQKTSPTFDAAGWEFFAPLVSGGTVVMAPPGAERDPAAIVRAAAAHGVTVLQVVPSVLRLLVEEPGLAECGSLRLLFSAGEPLHAELCRRVLDQVPVEIWNTYGPTECAIDVTAHRVDPAVTSGPVPIGGPIDNTRVLVLDVSGRPVPVGVAGELYAGGAGVARGYLGRPDLTAERFVPDPYGPPGARLYRTGDLVRWREGGSLDYLGRLDHQVKINGVRVEPGEVEAALAAHPAVRAAVVTDLPDATGASCLVAYVVESASPGTATAPSPADDGGARVPGLAERLRGFLRERLPSAFVPAIFVELDELPLTPSGKPDRAALPVPDPATGTGRPAYVAPRNAAEQAIADVWAELLGVERVGAHDDFFRLGGSSLLLARLAGRLRAASTGGDPDLSALFQETTVEAQARLLAGPSPAAAPPPITAGSAKEAPLSFGQERLWFLDRMRPGSAEWVAPLIVRLDPGTGTGTVRDALTALAARHEILRTRYVADAGRPRQVIDDAAPVVPRVVDVTRQELAAVYAEEFERGFDLESGPVWRSLLIRVAGEAPLLLLTMHHIACDGWSSAVLAREVRELCAAAREGREPRLPEPGVRYADYAAWQRQWLTDDVIGRELEHWRRTLDGMQPLRFPTDRPRPPRRDHHGAVIPFVVPRGTAGALDRLAREDGGTLFTALLSGFAALLARYTGQRDVVIGTPVAGRVRPELEGVVGFFLNSLVLRCDLSGEPDLRDLLRRIRRTCSSAFAHQHLPFELLVDDLRPERDLSRTPLYQVAFDLHDERLTDGGADTSDMETYRQAWRVAKTDLTLFMRRRPDGALAGAFEYATSLFDAGTIERLADHFVRLLDVVVRDPSAPVSTVGFLPAGESAGTAGARLEIRHRVDEEFERQAAAVPGAPAVVAGDLVVGYAELDERANRLAHHLRALGVRRESRVAVLLDRSPDLVAAFLGVWKAGGAYLPLDPSYPAERITAMLDDADVRMVVTASAYADRFDRPCVLLDRDGAEIEARPGTAPSRRGGLDDLAYVVFTSGSTGRPKGVG
ncbi:amino acid adenylation domain-containing protein, partial [Actinoallomurus spadix]